MPESLYPISLVTLVITHSSLCLSISQAAILCSLVSLTLLCEFMYPAMVIYTSERESADISVYMFSKAIRILIWDTVIKKSLEE